MQRKIILFISFNFFLVIFNCNFLVPQTIQDIIQPLHLTSGKEDSILISDIFFSENYNVEFFSNKNIDVKYSAKNKFVHLKPSENFEGLGLIKFRLDSNEFYMPFYSKIKQTHVFKFENKNHFKKINLFGNFNNWNRNNLQMKDENDDGIYKIAVELDPGIYEYKFFIDGKEILDPENPKIKPNGLGGFNSIITISSRHPEKAYLHILNKKENQDSVQLSFFYKEENQRDSINYSNVIALINNRKIPDDQIKITRNKIVLSLKKNLNDHLTRPSGSHIRIAINKNGKTTNIQNVYLEKNEKSGAQNFNEMIIYSLLTDRFFNGNIKNDNPIIHDSLSFKANYQGGDFQGIIDKLKQGYFDSLGINTIWIFPVNDNPNSAFREYPAPHRYYTGYHGYWPISSTRIEEHLGNINLFKELVKTAHRHNIKILLDFVSHHIHIENPYWENHRDWFGNLKLPDGKLNLRLWDEQRLTTWFEPYMPSFDYENSDEALDTMTTNAVWWIKENGIDGFRHDAVKHVPNIFWWTLTKKIKEEIEIPQRKKIYQIGETFGGYDLVSSYVNNGQLNAQFNFNLYDTAVPVFLDSNSSFKSLDLELQKTFLIYGVNNLMGNIMDSHDKVRFMAYADGDMSIGSSDPEIGWNNPPQVDHEFSYKKAKLYLAYLLTIPGIPIIYYGDEIGMTGAADPDNRRMMRFGDQLSGWENEMLEDVKKLIKLRRKNSALNYGDFQTLIADKNCYVYLRSDFNERILVALNKSGSSKTVTINLPYFYNIENAKDVIERSIYKIKSNIFNFKIPASGYKIFNLMETEK